MRGEAVSSLLSDYERFRRDIESRLEEFSRVWRDLDEEAMWGELYFCLMTPQSRATACFEALSRLGGLDRWSEGELRACLRGVRFWRSKASYLAEARSKREGGFSLVEALRAFEDPILCREALAGEFRGLGMKEASHFLRNVGYSFDLAILDRHILREMADLGLLESLPSSLSKSVYLSLERLFVGFAGELGMSAASLDLLLWARRTGFVFR